MGTPFLNITMPVFNRYHLTQKTILLLQKIDRTIPFSLTVVDNGSEKRLRDRLVDFAKDKIIDNLFLLERNMGIACACNIGWKSLDSPFFMKIDNDIVIKDPYFLTKLFKLWSYGKPLSTLGPAMKEEWIKKSPEIKETPYGILARCKTNLPGCALIIPKKVSDLLGYFNEDYALYGAEDGDYGFRMNCARFPQYYYEPFSYFSHEPEQDEFSYSDANLDKQEEHNTLFLQKDGSIGTFTLNTWLFNLCIRSWNVPPRYELQHLSGYNYNVIERKDYQKIRLALERSRKIVQKKEINDIIIKILKKIWIECDQECVVSNLM